MSDLSLIRYNVTAFFSIILNARPFIPVFTQQYKIVDALIRSENPTKQEKLDQLKKIYDTTHEKVNFPLSIVELVVFKNLDRGLSRDVEVNNKTFPLIKLYQYLDEVSLQLSKIVIEIAKEYSVDIPMNFNRASNSGITLDQ